MEIWRRVWRQGLAPRLPMAGLQALRKALIDNDPRLLQWVTTDLPPIRSLRGQMVCGACAISYCGWQGLGLSRQGDVLRYFDDVCEAAENALEEPGSARHFFDWYDQTPRIEMRCQLFPEVEAELARRSLRQAA